MKNVFGFVDLYNTPSLENLTLKRNFGAVTFLGRYGLIDFSLSNFTNSGIDKIGIISDRFSTSIHNHIQYGFAFTSNTRIGSLVVLNGETSGLDPKHNTDVANVSMHYKNLFEHRVIDYIIIAPAYNLMSVDYSRVLKYHQKCQARITMLCQHRTDLDKNFLGHYLWTLEDKKIKKGVKNRGKQAEGDICLNTAIINRDYFEELIQIHEQPEYINLSFIDLIHKLFIQKKVELNAYIFPKPVFPILSFDDYIKTSFEMLKASNRAILFHENWPIYTTTHNTPPTLYGSHSDVKNSFIANGSRIDGKVKNSIISREVAVAKGASIKNCIIFTDTIIEEGVTLEYVISDKSAVIAKGNKIQGSKEKFAIIRQGERV